MADAIHFRFASKISCSVESKRLRQSVTSEEAEFEFQVGDEDEVGVGVRVSVSRLELFLVVFELACCKT